MPTNPLQPHLIETPFYRVGLSPTRPEFTAFCLDSLGGGEVGKDLIIRDESDTAHSWHVLAEAAKLTYMLPLDGERDLAGWQFDFDSKQITIRSQATAQVSPPAIRLKLDQKANHATVLGLMRSKRIMDIPCILHLPDLGTARITCNIPGWTLGYDARRRGAEKPYVEILFPPATPKDRVIEYTLEVTTIHPELPGIETDTRYDGFRRNFLSLFQINPRLASLANNSSSDFAAFCMYEYADLARQTPALADGLSCLDMVRMTLERLMGGMKAYGLVGWTADSQDDADILGDDGTHWALDSYPAMLIAGCVYIEGKKDWNWAKLRYEALSTWCHQMLKTDHNGNGLIEHYRSGNTGSWAGQPEWRASNWWDAVGFGHEDAYANALAYRACLMMAKTAADIGNELDRTLFLTHADKIRASFRKTFFNPVTGLLAGWKSADGTLHDYSFTFVNSIAVCYDLVDGPDANAIMTRLLGKMKSVGFNRFDLGLPGNLTPIPPADYVDLPKDIAKRCGVGEKADGSDSFQNYENGGATGCWAYFTIKALFKLGRKDEARGILYPMLASFKTGEFQGFGANGMSKDWKNWSGVPYGYEGFLSDNYFTLLAVIDDRSQEDST